MTIGERIAQLLKDQGKMAKDLAAYLGISASSVTGWIHGSYPSSQYIIKISEFLDVSAEFLLSGNDDKEDETDKVRGISMEGLKVGCLWDHLDEAGKAIILGDIYKRLEAVHEAEDAGGRPLKEAL